MKLKIPPETEQRPSKLASTLRTGDWLCAADAGAEQAVQVITTAAYADPDGEKMLAIMYQRPGGEPSVVSAYPDDMVRLATDAEAAALTEAARRAKFVADVRAFAAWIEDRPWLPLPAYALGADVQINLHGQAGIDRVRQAGEDLNVEPRVLDDRTSVGVDLGSVTYRIIAWHDRPGPALAQPVADPTGNGYSREVDNGDPAATVPAGVDGSAMTGRGE